MLNSVLLLLLLRLSVSSRAYMPGDVPFVVDPLPLWTTSFVFTPWIVTAMNLFVVVQLTPSVCRLRRPRRADQVGAICPLCALVQMDAIAIVLVSRYVYRQARPRINLAEAAADVRWLVILVGILCGGARRSMWLW